MFYKVIVQSTLLYGSETWDVTIKVIKALSGFHHQVAQRLSGHLPCYLQREDQWVYPQLRAHKQ
jgi:hypothetical protein